MNIELKRFTTNARLSQETTAFAADVWVDGRKAGRAESDGRGGATVVHLDPSVRDQVEAHGRTLVPAEYQGLTSGAEWLVDQLVEALLQKRLDQNFAKKMERIDARERTSARQRGLVAARLRSGSAWLWFAFKTGTDPKVTADAIATRRGGAVDELVVISPP